MIRNIILLIFWAGFPCAIVAQNTLQGILKQEDNKAIPMANIRLLDPSNNTLVGYTTTAINGNFELPVKSFGKYYLIASGIGYIEMQKLIEVTTVSTTVNFILKEDVKQLAEITINTKSLEVYQKNDTISFNLKKLTTGRETNLKEVLKKLPGISLENGKIYAQGKVINKILINGDEFALNQRTLSETLAAKMLSGIDLLKEYKQNTILSDFNTQEEQALNLKIKKEYLGVFKGEIGLGSGQVNKYNGRGFGYNLGDKFKTSIITDLNNTGENPITISEFIELKGGILSLFGNRPSPLSNEIGLNNSIIPMSSMYASKVKNEFGSCNINYRYSPKTKITASLLVFNTGYTAWDESMAVYTLGDKTITIQDNSNTQKTSLLQQGNASVEYRKSANENIVYKLSQAYSNVTNEMEVNTSNFLWQHFYEQASSQNQFIDQDLSLLKRYSNTFILYTALHHTFENKVNNKLWFDDKTNQSMNQTYDFERNYLSGEFQMVYKPIQIQYEYNLGLRHNSTTNHTNLLGSSDVIGAIYPNTLNELRYNNTNVYSNFLINKKTGFFEFLVSFTPSYFLVGTQKRGFLLYNLKANFYFTKNNHLDFSTQNDYTLIEAQKTFTGLFANSYRDFAASNLPQDSFTGKKSYNLSYYFSKVITGTNIYASLSYSELTNAITTNTQTSSNAQYDITSYLLSPLQKKHSLECTIEQRLGSLPVRLKLKGNFDSNNFVSYSQGNANALLTKNYNTTLSFQTTLKSAFNTSGGFYLENTTTISALWNTTNELLSYKPYLNLEYEHKGFVVSATGTYNSLSSGNNQIKYLDLSPQLKYKRDSSLWEFSLEGNNVLNLNTIALISADYGNNYFQTSKYSRLSGYLLVKIKRFF
jgi:hypothetical protein